MIRTEISLFLKNAPGELGKLTTLLFEGDINIDASMIQDASSYVRKLFEARGKSLKRVASHASYNSVHKDSAQFALVRLLVDKPDEAMNILKEHKYLFDSVEVAAVKLKNNPGEMAKITRKFGEEGININYIYGSVASRESSCLFVFCPEDIELASKIFNE